MEAELTGLVGIEEIHEDAVILKNGSMVAVLEITPIDFDSMGQAKKKKALKAYREWIESLDYPVQISMKTFNHDVVEQAEVLKNRVEYTIKQKEEYRDLLKEYKEFEEWLDSYLKKSSKKGTVYYLVIPYVPGTKKRMFKFLAKKKAEEEKKNSIEMLNKRVAESAEKLEKTGVKAHRLKEKQLRNLYMSYFAVTNKTGSNGELVYSSPDDWFEKFKAGVKE